MFRLSHRGKSESLMQEYAGSAAIGHVRYATCGREDRCYAQPFERHHLEKHKWFSFGFNGQLANYQQLRRELLVGGDHHLARETDTEIIMHESSLELSGDGRPKLIDVMRNVARKFDGAYSLVLLNARGEMLVARDPLGVKPLCYAHDGALFAAASESVALLNLGIRGRPDSVAGPRNGRHDHRRQAEHRAIRRQPAAGTLLFRMDLFRQRGKHAGRTQCLPVAHGPGRRVGRAGVG